MNIFEFLKSLSTSERHDLADEVGASYAYLINCACRKKIGVDLVERIYDSAINAKRPKAIQFTKDEWHQFQIERAERALTDTRGHHE